MKTTHLGLHCSRILLLLTIFLCTAVAAHACPPCDDFDFTEGDYSLITDWSQVDQADIPDERVSEIPPDDVKFGELKKSQKKQLTSTQIEAHLDEIEVLSDLDETHARSALKDKYGIEVQHIQGGLRLVDGTLGTKKGAFDTTGKDGWEIDVDEKGNIKIIKPAAIHVDSITTKDQFVLSEEVTLTKESGFPVKVKGVHVENGELFVKKGSTAAVGGFEVSSKKNNVMVNFNPFLKPKGNAVTIAPTGVEISTEKKGSVTVVGIPGNELFAMQRYDEWSDPLALTADEKSSLKISVSGGDSLEITDRSKDGLTPFIAHSNNGGHIDIDTGRLHIEVKKGQIMTAPPRPSHQTGNYDNSVAFEFRTNKDSVDEVFRTSSSNRFAFLQDDFIVLGNNAETRVSNEIEPNLMKTTYDLQRKYPDLSFEYMASKEEIEQGIEYGITANTAQLLDEWLESRPGMEKIVPTFVIGRKIATVYDYSDDQMELGEHNLDLGSLHYHALEGDVGRNLHSPFDVFEHEMDHSIDRRVATHEEKKPSTDPTLEQLYEEKRNEIMDDLEKSETYQKQWKRIEKHDGFAHYVLDEDYDQSALNQMDEMGLSEENKRGRTIDLAVGLGLFNDDYSDLKKDSKKLEEIIHQETGLAAHAFRTGTELEAVYGELEIRDARRYPDLAQLEYDRILSLPDAPQWLIDEAEERYWDIMDGEDSEYCKNNACGKCVKYTRTCSP